MDALTTLIPGLTAPIELIRSAARRRSVSLRITDTPSVVVRAPVRMPLATITRFILQRTAWIETQMRKHAAFGAQYPRCHGCEGDRIFVLGMPRVVRIITDASTRRVHCAITTDAFTMRGNSGSLSANQRRSRIAAHLRAQAETEFPSRTQLWARTMHLTPSRIIVRAFTRRWGCCTHDGEIRLNWRLIMCPLHIVDYLIVHELAHLRFHHHRPTFWRLVEKFHPEWRESRRWLNTHGSAITKMV